MSRALALRATHGTPGRTIAVELRAGSGWSVDDVVCTCGSGDRPFDEQHRTVSIAVVIAGTFGYRTSSSYALMTPGSLFLGNAGQGFTCEHTHAAGDRCVSFHFSEDLFDRLAADAGLPRGERAFRAPRIPALRESSRAVARASLGVLAPQRISWEETAVEMAHLALQLSAGVPPTPASPSSRAIALATESARRIERDPAGRWTLQQLAADAGLSPFQYLRAFTRLTGVTPHQFVLRARLRAAAICLATQEPRVIDVAAMAGFDDLSNFNHAFKAEFGLTPLTYRRTQRREIRSFAAPPEFTASS